jgi:hypothetical protein
LKRFPKGENYQWGVIDESRQVDSSRVSPSIRRLLRKLSQEQQGSGIPLALEALSRDAVARGEGEDAERLFGMLKDGYPHAVGLATLAEEISDLPDEPSKDTEAEKLTGTYYSVRVGIFSQKQNADQQAARCKGDSLSFLIDTKQVSGKLYYVVYIGRFRALAEAERLKKQLESTFGETYQVTAR